MEGLPVGVGSLLSSMGTESALVLDEFASWCPLPLEQPNWLDDVKLDAFGFEFIDDSDRNQLPVFADGEVLNFLCHGLFEFVPVWLCPGFAEVHGVRVSSYSCVGKGLDERMDAADGPI